MNPRVRTSAATARRPSRLPFEQAYLQLPPSSEGGSPAIVIAFELDELGREDIKVRMNEAGRLSSLLVGYSSPGLRHTYSFQILSTPDSRALSHSLPHSPESGAPARGKQAKRAHSANVRLALLVRLTPLWGQDEAKVVAAARQASGEVLRLLTSAMPSAWFSPVVSRRALQRLLVLPHLGDLVELRPRWLPASRALSLPTPMPGVPDLAFLVDELRAEGCATLLSLPFEPADGVVSLAPLLALADDASAAPIGALLSHAEEQEGDHGSASDETLLPVRPSSRASTALLEQWLAHKLPELRDAYRVGIRLGASRPLSSSFLRLFCAEFAGEGKLVAEQTWRRAPHPLTPAVDPTRPLPGRDSRAEPERIEWEIARDNFERLEFAGWGDPACARRPLGVHGLDDEVTLATLARLVSKEHLAHLIPLPTVASWLPTHVTPLPIAVETLPTTGAHLGATLAGRHRVPVLWPQSSRILQSILLGSTGTGKSTLVANLILEDARAGHAIVALDPHGQLIDAILPRIPRERLNDVILFDVEDVERPIGINPLDLQTDEERARFVTSFIGQLKQLFDPHNQAVVGPVAMQGLRAAMQGAMSLPNGGTLLECYRFFIDEDYLKYALTQMTDQTAIAYFRQFRAMSERERAEYSLHIISKLSEWCADPVMRRIIGQRTSSFSFADAINSKKIVLLRLASGFIGTEKATFLGHTFLPMIFQAALSRASLPEEERQFTSIWLDEAGIFGSEVIASMLAQARKYNIAANLVGQHFAQFLPSVRDAVLANANNILAFRLGVPDALLVERIFGSPAVDEHYLTQLPRGTVAARVMLEGGEPSAPFTLETEPLRGEANAGLAAEIREYSRMTYGRPRAEVDAEIAGRETRPPREPNSFNLFS